MTTNSARLHADRVETLGVAGAMGERLPFEGCDRTESTTQPAAFDFDADAQRARGIAVVDRRDDDLACARFP